MCLWSGRSWADAMGTLASSRRVAAVARMELGRADAFPDFLPSRQLFFLHGAGQALEVAHQ
jgi:hypothetical protein